MPAWACLLQHQPDRACSQVLEKASPNIKGLLISAGARGCSYIFRAKDGSTYKGYVPVLKIKVEDTTGAGDAFLGGFLVAMVKVNMHAIRALLQSPPIKPTID